ncbi:sensor domain-containing diguanylate cyclase [Bosea sp. BH3]|uniref:GGDEF domain-containing protein n=1 Tax=Bosea sp. BH3 TaxID=2871701 RepID=UPI0021CB1A76|nr:GGDEF domain-containing protein [Bosea sp. BH3]MCU4180982.1 GGDEF domain-containing protein [Bosea sp. BH3]
MNSMVSLSFVQACVLAFLGLLCIAIYFGMRRQSSLAWLAVALLCGSVEVLIISLSNGSFFELLAATVLVPAAYLCVGRSVGIVTGERRPQSWLLATVVGLVGLALVLLFTQAPFVYQTLPFQLACGLAVTDSILRLLRARERGILGMGLMLTLTGIAGVFFMRVPLFPLLFEGGAPYLSVRDSALEKGLMRFTALATPTAVFLLLGKIIGAVIENYRTRSERDSLTALLNRRALDELIQTNRSRGGSLILCDIDHFKDVNDRYGHSAGDEIICAFARLLEQPAVHAARIGGEEFALLLPGIGASAAAELADAVRARFSAAGHPLVPRDYRLSASFGVAAYEAGEALKEVFARADVALYRAKHEGRDRVAVYRDGDARDPASAARKQAA